MNNMNKAETIYRFRNYLNSELERNKRAFEEKKKTFKDAIIGLRPDILNGTATLETNDEFHKKIMNFFNDIMVKDIEEIHNLEKSVEAIQRDYYELLQNPGGVYTFSSLYYNISNILEDNCEMLEYFEVELNDPKTTISATYFENSETLVILDPNKNPKRVIRFICDSDGYLTEVRHHYCDDRIGILEPPSWIANPDEEVYNDDGLVQITNYLAKI